MRGFILSVFTIAAATALATGCGSETSTVPVVGSIDLSVTPAGATIQQGGSTQVTGTIVRSNFTGDVAISVAGAPSGVTGTVTLAPVGGGNTAQVTLAASSGTAVGTYPLTVTASGSGVASDSATFALTITAATPASFTMTLGSPTLSLAQGGTAPSTLTFARTAFTGNIALTAENLPTGVTAVFGTNPVGGVTSSVTFNATAAAPPGTFNTVLIRGTSSGLTDVTAAVALTVSITGSYSIAPGNGTLNVVQGNNITTSVNATRAGGFAGTIVYAVTGPASAALPAGLTAAVAPTGTADQNTLTVTTAASLAPATYPIVVHATSFGLEQTASINVIVAFAGATVRLDYSQCAASGKPLWLAYQDGAGAFARVVGVGDLYTFNVTSSKGAYAAVTGSAGGYSTNVQYFSQAEAGALVPGCTAASAVKTVNGTVASMTASDYANVSMGGSGVTIFPPLAPFQLVGVAAGAQDLVAYRRNSATAGGVNDRLIIRRGLDVANGGSLAVIDFANPLELLLPTTATFTVTNAAAGKVQIQDQRYLTGNACTSHDMYSKSGVGATLFVYGVPVGSQAASDFYRFTVTEEVAPAVTRSLATSFHTLAARSVTLPAMIGANATVATSALNTYRLMQSIVVVPADYQSVMFTYSETTTTLRGAAMNGIIANGNAYTITHSAGYLNGAGTTTMTATDFGGITGFQAIWGPSKFSAINYVTTGTGVTGGSACTEGSTTKSSSIGGNVSTG